MAGKRPRMRDGDIMAFDWPDDCGIAIAGRGARQGTSHVRLIETERRIQDVAKPVPRKIGLPSHVPEFRGINVRKAAGARISVAVGAMFM